MNAKPPQAIESTGEKLGWPERRLAGMRSAVRAMRRQLDALSAMIEEEAGDGVLLDCRNGNQRCHECPDLECGDNMSPAKLRPEKKLRHAP